MSHSQAFVEFAGRPQDLGAWQACHQAIGYLRATGQESSWMVGGLEAAAAALAQPLKADELATSPDERTDDTAARIKLYRSNTGTGWTAAWFVDRPGDRAPESGGMVGHHETARSALESALEKVINGVL